MASSMRSKRSGSVSEHKSSADDDFKAKDVKQAVLLADSFKVRFRPVTLERPKVLLPLCNVPMIDYTLEFLVSGGIDHIFVFCVAHAKQIREYLDNSKWAKSDKFTVECVETDSCGGPGDALRHMDTLDKIKGDFILLSGDVVANFPLAKVLKLHKERVKASKLNVATIVMKKAAPDHRTRTLDDDLAVALCADSGQLLQFTNEKEETGCELSTQLLDERRAVEFRYDLMDCHIDIISPEGLLLFADNPDWFSREHFIKGVLEDEILGNKITAHVIAGDYAARVQDLRTYDSVSKDIIQRWTFPLVPDNNLMGYTSYQYARRNVYKETTANFARSCVIGENSVIGGGSTIGANTVIDHSVIGPNCVIGSGARITGSYLWGNCTIEDGVRIDRAIVCDGVIIRANAIISHGSIISFNACIGNGFTVAPYTKLTTLVSSRWALETDSKLGLKPNSKASRTKKIDTSTTPPPASSSSSSSSSSSATTTSVNDDSAGKAAPLKRTVSIAPNTTEVGVDGIGRVYTDDEPDGIVFNTIAPTAMALNLVNHPEDDNLSDFDDDYDADAGVSDDNEDDDDSKEAKKAPAAATGSRAKKVSKRADDDDGDDEEPSKGEDDNTRQFIKEVQETLNRGHHGNMEVDGIILDMTSLQLSMHVTDTTYFTATFSALLSFVQGLPDPSSAGAAPLKLTKTAMVSLKSIFKHWKLALTKFGKKTQAQLAMLHGLEAACLRPSLYQILFPIALQWLYDEDALTEDVIFQWEEDTLDKELPGPMGLVKRAKVFLEWLRDAEEEDSDE